MTGDLTPYTKAALFAEAGNSCETFVRFSTVAGERGAAVAERDIRGFAVRFFTSQGNWDVVGNNTPVFFFRDPLKFPDPAHAVKRPSRCVPRSSPAQWYGWYPLGPGVTRTAGEHHGSWGRDLIRSS